VQVLEAAVTGLDPGKPYVLALSNEPTGAGALESLQSFMSNPAGSAIVNAIGPIRQVLTAADSTHFSVAAGGRLFNIHDGSNGPPPIDHIRDDKPRENLR